MTFSASEIFNTVASLIPAYSIDTVAVFSQDYVQLFRGARPIKAVVKEVSKLMEHPIENGAVITDHRIVLPVEIQLSMILTPDTYKQTYNQIRQLYNEGTMLIVQTKSGIYTNQLIQQVPHEEDPTIFDTITLAISLKQVQMVTAQYTTLPRAPKNTSTVDRGAQNTTPVTPASSETTLLKPVKWFANLFRK